MARALRSLQHRRRILPIQRADDRLPSNYLQLLQTMLILLLDDHWISQSLALPEAPGYPALRVVSEVVVRKLPGIPHELAIEAYNLAS